MIENLKLGSLLHISFGLVLSLLIIVAGVSYIGLSSLHEDFLDYRSSARNTNLVGRVQANMLMMRLSVFKYINTGENSSVKEFYDRNNSMRVFLKESEVEINDPSMSNLIKGIMSEVRTYEEVFENVVGLIGERNRVVSDKLNPSGLAARQAISEIITSAYDDGDSEGAYYAGLVQQHLLLGRLYVNKFLLTNAHDDASRAEFELSNSIKSHMKILHERLEGDHRKAEFVKAKKSYELYVAAFTTVKEIILRRNDYINNSLNNIGPRVSRGIEKTKLSLKDEQDNLGPRLQSFTERTIMLLIIISSLSLIFGIGISVLMIKLIRRPIGGEPKEIADFVQHVSRGDLSRRLELNGRETGIYKSVSEMSGRLSILIKSIVDAGSALRNSSKGSLETANKNVTIIEQQKAVTEQVAAAVEEITVSIQEVANNAAVCAEKSNIGKEETIKGGEAVSATVQSVNLLSENLNQSMVEVKDLVRQSAEIGDVIDVIQSISEQTNLLALNAAIEAARAGEQGRGFAVVADEVRALAQRTRDSTAEIQEIIQNLQTGTDRAVHVMEKSVTQAAETVDYSYKTDVSLKSIDKMIDDISNMNQQVAVAVQQQSEAALEVAANIVHINDTFNESIEGAYESKKASQLVRDMSDKLNNIAGEFKV